MRCDEVQGRLVDFIDKSLTKKEAVVIKEHLHQCPQCQEEFNKLSMLFKDIDNDVSINPPAEIRSNFEKLLAEEKNSEQDQNVIQLHDHKRNYWKPLLQIAATLILMFFAYHYGKTENESHFNEELATVENEKQQIKQDLTISLIESESASKRLQAVNYAEQFDKPDNRILEALIDKMYYDKHANVRLAAAEALKKFSEKELVKKSFIKALEIEEDPGIQIELIQILVSIEEKRAVPSMQKILNQEETPDYVKDQVKVALPSLI